MLCRETFVERAVRAYEKKYGIPEGWWANRSDIRSPSGYRITRSSYRRFVVSKVDARGRRVFFGAFRRKRLAIGKIRQLEKLLAAVSS